MASWWTYQWVEVVVMGETLTDCSRHIAACSRSLRGGKSVGVPLSSCDKCHCHHVTSITVITWQVSLSSRDKHHCRYRKSTKHECIISTITVTIVTGIGPTTNSPQVHPAVSSGSWRSVSRVLWRCSALPLATPPPSAWQEDRETKHAHIYTHSNIYNIHTYIHTYIHSHTYVVY